MLWPKLAAAALLAQGALAADCPYTVSVLDVAGVQCVSSAPCSGTYYASGLSQGVGACPSGTSCALLPLTPIMGCAQAGRSDLIYVNADGSLTKDGKSVDVNGNSVTSSTTGSKTSSSKSSKTSSTTSSTTSSSTSSKSSSTKGSSSNAASGSGLANSTDGGSDANTTSSSNTTSASHSSNNHSSDSWSGSGSNVISPGSSSANQQAEFNPGSILSDGSNKSSKNKDSGLGIGAIMGIVVGCLAVVAIAAGMRLLKKGKEAELETPEAGGAVEDYGGGGGMTPKENVLLL